MLHGESTVLQRGHRNRHAATNQERQVISELSTMLFPRSVKHHNSGVSGNV